VKALILAGLLTSIVAVAHVGIIWVGGPAYRYFGAGEEMARLAEQGSLRPGLITAGLTILFAVWAMYAFSGAGVLRRLPLLRTGLVFIGTLYVLRGILVGPQLVWRLSGYSAAVPIRQLFFSSVSLIIGLAYLIGTHQSWDRLKRVGASADGDAIVGRAI